MENMGNNHNNYHHIHCKLTSCIVSIKNWDTKEDKGKSMMHVLYVLQLAKRHILGQSGMNSEKIKPVPLCIVELCSAEASVN